ncbi:MAG TPA: RagB/SusD family nutrient uptake outer membrane protein [Bacteroidales bacterium]|nr:RagB/SusD family nutrient uptake outer membrane protein [Bacteroidales bacterium]
MKKLVKYSGILWSVMIALVLFPSCEKFMNPDQELKITKGQLYDDWYEYRSVEMGMYGLQQKLVEQLLVLGELRGDLLKITPNADADLVEVYNFNISKTNKYASPENFFKLISACNNLINVLETNHPEVTDKSVTEISNYDRLYGEALCMRAWAYFNAARIYGKVPFIPESLVTMQEIEKYVNSKGPYVDSVHIIFGLDGYHNDTISAIDTTLEKQYYDTRMITDHFTNELETKVKAVGVNHYIDNNDDTWEITIWSPWSMHSLLGQMYLNQGNYAKAAENFDKVIKNNTETHRYQIDNSFQGGFWSNIFTTIDNREHIYTIWFNKTYFQQNNFQNLFEPLETSHAYMLKPTKRAIDLWETVWRNQIIIENNTNPSLTRMAFVGIPTDFYRGYGISYLYYNNSGPLMGPDFERMIMLRAQGDVRNSKAIMEGMDTVATKYSLGKNSFSNDANYIIYRAAGINLYMAEIYAYWAYPDQYDVVHTYTAKSLNLINDGSYFDPNVDRVQMGVRGRVGLGSGDDGIRINNIQYIHDPYTNKITGYKNLTNNLEAKQKSLENQIMDERARELAFEGERFYDLMRVAKRRHDPSYLAEKVAAKYPAGQRDQIYSLLLDENNWYVHYFDDQPAN